MSRSNRRKNKKSFQKDIVEFLKVQHHFLPNFIDELGKIKDPRHNSYTDYDGGVNIQKNHRYNIEHANSLNYSAMKNHYLLTQLADLLVQL